MSFLKAALSLAAVAGVAYVGYKAAKKHPTATAAILTAMANSSSSSSSNQSRSIHVRETETVIKANKDKMEGVMGVSSRAKDTGTKVNVRTDSRGTHVEVNTPKVVPLRPMAYEDAEKRFGGLDK